MANNFVVKLKKQGFLRVRREEVFVANMRNVSLCDQSIADCGRFPVNDISVRVETLVDDLTISIDGFNLTPYPIQPITMQKAIPVHLEVPSTILGLHPKALLHEQSTI